MKLDLSLNIALSRADRILRMKMIKSIELIRKAQHLADIYDPEYGFTLGFSGGKDSQCLYHIAELAGAKFKAIYSPTTVDPPEVIRFIKTYYPEVEFGKVRKNIYQMAVDKKVLPTRKIRWCCAEFKEKGGAGKVNLVGVRHDESTNRSHRDEVGLQSKKFSGTIDEFLDYHEEHKSDKFETRGRPRNEPLQFDQFSEHKEQMVSCVSGRDKIIISPLLDWKTYDVWMFLNQVCKVPHNPLYDEGFTRIGCAMCPMATTKKRWEEAKRWPYMKAKWIDSIQKIMQSKEEGRETYQRFEIYNNPAEACFDWWMSGLPYEEWKEHYTNPTLF